MDSGCILYASLSWSLKGHSRHHRQRLSPHLSRQHSVFKESIRDRKQSSDFAQRDIKMISTLLPLETSFLSSFVSWRTTVLLSCSLTPLLPFGQKPLFMSTTKSRDFRNFAPENHRNYAHPSRHTALCFPLLSWASDQGQHIQQRDWTHAWEKLLEGGSVPCFP